MIYLDHNATTPLLPEVVDAMLPYFRDDFGNPSSGHALGARARQAVERARMQVAALLGCDADEVVFTSGGTEANNLAIRGATEARQRRHLVTSVIEHPATAGPCALLERRGWRVSRVGVDGSGRLHLDDLAKVLDPNTALVTVMHSNNETGVLQPIEDVVQLARRVGALVHTDAAQSVGKIELSARDLGVDLLSVAGHKLYAPKGVGALFVRRGTAIAPLAIGGGQERGLRPGTENVPAIVGLGAACALAARDLSAEAGRVRALRDTLWSLLRSRVPGIEQNGHPELRLPNTLSVRFPQVAGAAVLDGAPEVAASTGAACHEGVEAASPVILAMGIGEADALGSIRLTLGRGTTERDVARAAEALAVSWMQGLRPSGAREEDP